MKTLLTIFTLIFTVMFSSTNSASGQQFRGVHEILTTEDMSDPFFLSAVIQRCSGLYTSLTIYSEAVPQKLKEVSMLNAVMGSKVAANLLNQKANKPSENKLKVQQLIRAYTSVYYKNLEKSQTMTGSIFSEWTKREFAECNNIFSNFK